MSTNQFAVLQGTGLSALDESVLQYLVEHHPVLQSRHKIRVQSFLKHVKASDLSMRKDFDELILMRFVTEKEVPEVTFRMTEGPPFHLRKIPRNVIRSCEAELDLGKLDRLPNLANDISVLTEKTGVDIYKDPKNSTLWVHGEWYQVSVAKSYLTECYASLIDLLELKCSSLSREELSRVVQWVNMDEVMWMDDEDLPMCTFAICKNIKYIKKIDDMVFRKVDGHIMFNLKSSHTANSYEYLKQNYNVVELTDELPIDYRNLLVEMVELKFRPEMVLTHQKQKNTYFLFPTSTMAGVKDFIRTYKRYNAPSNACGIQFMQDIALERKKTTMESFDKPSIAESLESGVSQSPKSGSTASYKTMKQVFTQRDRLHMKYFCVNYMDNIKDFVQKYNGTVTYVVNCNEDKLEIYADDPKCQKTILRYIEKLYQDKCIITEVIGVTQLMHLSNIKEAVQVSPGKDTSTVYITGPITSISVMTSNSHSCSGSVDKEEEQPALMEATGADGEYTSGNVVRRRRNRELLPDSATLDQTKGRKNVKETRVHESSPMVASSSLADTGPLTVYLLEKNDILIQNGTGDITKLEVSAIVNAANKELKHVGGVARAISVAAGPEFDDLCQAYAKKHPMDTGDVCVTNSGILACQMVIHAVGPKMRDYEDQEDCFRTLQKTFYNCLDEANKRGCTSIAIPAISAGVYGVDPDMVAHTLTEAIQDFLTKYPDSALRLIRLIDISENIVDKFNQHLMQLVKKGTLKKIEYQK